MPRGARPRRSRVEFLINELGINGLKSVGGTLALNAGNYNSLTKTFFLAPTPVQGLLKVFSLPPVDLRPEAWVPASVASYQSLSWDLDNAYNAINDLVNKFQPGMLNVLEQQLAGPEGGQPLSFQKDLFGPLGDRITMISDFKKPIKEDSQRVLVGVALEDAKAFQNTLGRVMELAGAAPKKREFQGTTIYDFDVPVPNLPNNPDGGNLQTLKGPISLAIAKDTLFVTTDTTLLEQILRPGGGPAGRKPDLPDRRQGDSSEGQRHDVRPSRRAGPAVLRHDQERPVREGHPSGHGRQPRRPGAGGASQDHQPGQASRLLGLRQVPDPGRQLQRRPTRTACSRPGSPCGRTIRERRARARPLVRRCIRDMTTRQRRAWHSPGSPFFLGMATSTNS